PFDVAPGNYVVRASYDDNFYSPNASRLHTAEDTLVIRADMVVGAGIDDGDLTPDGDLIPGGSMVITVRAMGLATEEAAEITAISGSVGIDLTKVELVGTPAVHKSLADVGVTASFIAETGKISFGGTMTQPVTWVDGDSLLTFEVKARPDFSGLFQVDMDGESLTIQSGTKRLAYTALTEEIEVLRTYVYGSVTPEWGETVSAIVLAGGSAEQPFTMPLVNWDGFWAKNVPAGTATAIAARTGYLPSVQPLTVVDHGVTSVTADLYYGDLDGDGAITEFDVAMSGMLMGQNLGDTYLDTNRDGKVDIIDLVAVARNSGREATSEWFGTVTGTLTYSGDAANAIQHPAVQLYLTNEDGVRAPIALVAAKPDGQNRFTFQFPKVLPGTYQLEVATPGYDPARQTVTVGKGQTVQVNLQTKPAVTMVVINDPAVSDDQLVHLLVYAPGSNSADAELTLGYPGSLTDPLHAEYVWDGTTEERILTSELMAGKEYSLWVVSDQLIGAGNRAAVIYGKQLLAVVDSADAQGSGDGWHVLVVRKTATGQIEVETVNEIVPLSSPAAAGMSLMAAPAAAEPTPKAPETTKR
ncbi:MAG TPA: PEGA domain-containing protein, partial [Symbiobacteriaceae bacterium]|nr:PEGA domain-containing protein [Symbiobacteriaceae bacterium]